MAVRLASYMQIGWVSVERSYAVGWYPTSLVRGAVSRLRLQPLPRFFSPFCLGSFFIIHVFYWMRRGQLGRIT